MSPLRVYFDPNDAPRTPLDSAIEWLLPALLIFCPFAFGAVEAWSEQVVIAICAAIALCLSGKLVLRREARFVVSWAILPIALFLTLVLFQRIPWPPQFIATVSPQTATLKQKLLSDLPNS